MKYVLAAYAAILVFLILQANYSGGYKRGFHDGTMDAYSHIDDNDPRCK